MQHGITGYAQLNAIIFPSEYFQLGTVGFYIQNTLL